MERGSVMSKHNNRDYRRFTRMVKQARQPETLESVQCRFAASPSLTEEQARNLAAMAERQAKRLERPTH
jgi:hypothetical protein